MRAWTRSQRGGLRYRVENDEPVCSIASECGRSFLEVIEQVAADELRSPVRPGPPPKVPRGKGYSKSQSEAAARVLLAFDGTIIEWARSQGLNPDLLATAMEQHGIGSAYLLTQLDHGKECLYCTRWYYPSNASQEFCSRKCGADARRDESYFGGRRRETLGLLAGICQVCGSEPQKGLSSHHVFGKENDPENKSMIAVCSGCHDLITRLSRRRFGTQPGSWEALITLASMRGGELPHVRVQLKD